jgi:hypothetical protein
MNTKLTLRMDEELIERAKRHSTRTGKSLSRLVAEFFAVISGGGNATGAPAITPRVRKLTGAISGAGVDERDHRRHLEEKHR